MIGALRKLIWVAMILGCLYGLSWFILANTINTVIRHRLDGETFAHGGAVTDVTTRGFPTRFETHLHGLMWRDAQGQTTRTEYLHLEMHPFSPHHLHISLPVGVDWDGVNINGDMMELNLNYGLSPALPLHSAHIRLRGVNAPPFAALESGDIWLDKQSGQEHIYQLRLAFEEFGLTAGHDIFEKMTLRGDINLRLFSAITFQTPTPRPQNVTITDLAVQWERVTIHTNGQLTLNADGTLSGDLTLNAKNWQDMWPIVRRYNLIPPDQQDQVLTLLTNFARSSGSENQLTLPLSIQQGHVRMGFIPLGLLPSFAPAY